MHTSAVPSNLVLLVAVLAHAMMLDGRHGAGLVVGGDVSVKVAAVRERRARAEALVMDTVIERDIARVVHVEGVVDGAMAGPGDGRRSKDAVFGERVGISLYQYCATTVKNEAITAASLPAHIGRMTYATQILNAPQIYVPLFVNVVASDQTCANDATATATLVGMNAVQVSSAANLVTDAHISTAVATTFNSFIAGI